MVLHLPPLQAAHRSKVGLLFQSTSRQKADWEMKVYSPVIGERILTRRRRAAIAVCVWSSTLR